MTDLDALLAANPPDPEAAVTAVAPTPRRCRRHEWWMPPVVGPDAARWHFGAHGPVCRRCGRVRDEQASRRGRTNRARGNAIERDVCRLLGITRVGHHGTETDGGTSEEWLRVQVKSGGAYPGRIDALLRALPAAAGQLRAVVHVTADGPGRRRRGLVTVDLDDFVEWFGSAERRTP